MILSSKCFLYFAVHFVTYKKITVSYKKNLNILFNALILILIER